ncbi:MAG: NERD domain-containing protein [Gammaproteobacteria bacterium]|nr:NERD domain-containing protein [Gammaproteobacteria bacterium]
MPTFFQHPATPYLVIILGLILILLINRRRLKARWLNFKSRYCLNRLGLEQLSNVRCPDGLGEYFTIDRLLLRDNGISLLVYKKYPGKIFCADHIEEWTQMLGQKSYKFKNPLFELDYQIKAVANCFPDIDFDGYLFFDHLAEFPKGHPARVIHPQAIPDELTRSNRHQVDTTVMAVWKQLQEMAADTETKGQEG